MQGGHHGAHAAGGEHRGHQLALVIGAIGVVFGDIGTSPLYAVKECFNPEAPHHVTATVPNVLGVMSLVFWSLTMVIVVKYLGFIMKADNAGQGGILALLALVPAKKDKNTASKRSGLIMLALFGTALLYGDGVITPAISVLSAVEGLEVATSALKPAVLPITTAVLIGLFLVQKKGTGGIGKVFGPMTLLWFAIIATLGAKHIIQAPGILRAIDPRHAIAFFVAHHGKGFLVLGSVFLVVTGGEALYADMGHFGRAPIRIGWYSVVFPALLLNYFGQCANLLVHPEAASNPFYALVPSWALYPVVAIATAATVVASQALISGAFSLTQQAVQLGLFPRVTIVHTSETTEGQIYIPEVNAGLLVACVACVLIFKSSTALASAYGIAVTGTMGITTIVYYFVVTKAWGWSPVRAIPLVMLFLVFDLAFFGANAAKFFDGGWFPVTMALVVFAVMSTWKTGRRALADAVTASLLPLDAFLADVATTNPHRVTGTAVFMASNPTGTPPVLLHHFKHNKVLHKQLVLL
ncbi:MAG: potassium transporter Kup, partial [Polyangiales bacterium]